MKWELIRFAFCDFLSLSQSGREQQNGLKEKLLRKNMTVLRRSRDSSASLSLTHLRSCLHRCIIKPHFQFPTRQIITCTSKKVKSGKESRHYLIMRAATFFDQILPIANIVWSIDLQGAYNWFMDSINMISLKCASCSASLQLSDKLNRFICNYCGTEQLLVNGLDGFFLRRLEDRLDSLEKTTEKGNIELALRRLREDLRLKLVQLEAISEEKAAALQNLESRKDSVKGTLVCAAIAQAVILKKDLAVSIYQWVQAAVILTALYQVHILGVVQKGRDELVRKYQPILERIRDEVAAIELKIRKKTRIVDS
jgi:DNA-directed RNA polymerase subunit RPC12/RpoP